MRSLNLYAHLGTQIPAGIPGRSRPVCGKCPFGNPCRGEAHHGYGRFRQGKKKKTRGRRVLRVARLTPRRSPPSPSPSPFSAPRLVAISFSPLLPRVTMKQPLPPHPHRTMNPPLPTSTYHRAPFQSPGARAPNPPWHLLPSSFSFSEGQRQPA
jgi:hypothetical protein